MGSASEGVMSHRNFNPAQEAETLEPKRHRRRRRQPKLLTGLHCHAPGGEYRPTDATMETGNGVPPHALSVRLVPHGGGANRMRRGRRMPEEAKARGNALDMLTSGRCRER